MENRTSTSKGGKRVESYYYILTRVDTINLFNDLTSLPLFIIADLHMTSRWPQLVVKNKSISLLWEVNSIFVQILQGKILLYWLPVWPPYHVVASQEYLVCLRFSVGSTYSYNRGNFFKSWDCRVEWQKIQPKVFISFTLAKRSYLCKLRLKMYCRVAWVELPERPTDSIGPFNRPQ